MCGRFDLHTPRSEVAKIFSVDRPVGDIKPRYNVAPGTQIAGVRAADEKSDDPVDVPLLWWGFRPQWVKRGAPLPTNARAEKVSTSSYFRSSFEKRRCLIPANGWYEWRQTDSGKVPYYFSHTGGELLMFAGIWTPTGEGVDANCAIVTEPARGIAREVHPRMPVVLDRSCWRDWMAPELTDRDQVRAAVSHLPEAQLRMRPISTRVNKPENDGPDLIAPVSALSYRFPKPGCKPFAFMVSAAVGVAPRRFEKRSRQAAPPLVTVPCRVDLYPMDFAR